MDLERMMQHEENTVKVSYLYTLLSKHKDPFKTKIKRDVGPDKQNRLNFIMNTKWS